MEHSNKENSAYNFDKIVEIIIRLAVLYLLIGWCLDILQPFILILIWGCVIAIAVYPLQTFFVKLFRGKKILASIFLIILMLSILIIPSLIISKSLYDGIHHIRDIYSQGDLLIPPPGDRVQSWPAIAKPIVDLWQLASNNLQGFILKYSEQIKGIGIWMFQAFAGIGKGVLQFVVSIIVAGVLLIYSDSVTVAAKKILRKLAGKKGDTFASDAVSIVRNVVKGIIGVAVIQSTMAGLGFFIAGVPFAGLWTILCLFLAIIQIGVGPVAIPIAIYMFSITDSLTATLLAIWLVITLISDNVLKPILLGRGAPAPMLVVFLGSIGGFIYNGFLGLFLGAVIITFGYKLVTTWMNTDHLSQ